MPQKHPSKTLWLCRGQNRSLFFLSSLSVQCNNNTSAFLFLCKWDVGNEASKGIIKGNGQWKVGLGICLAKLRKGNVREINKHPGRHLLNFATSNISWKLLSAALKSLWSVKRQSTQLFYVPKQLSPQRQPCDLLFIRIFECENQELGELTFILKHLKYLGFKSLNCTWMLLNYFSIYQSEKGQQERTEGENRLGWSKYNEERDK